MALENEAGHDLGQENPGRSLLPSVQAAHVSEHRPLTAWGIYWRFEIKNARSPSATVTFHAAKKSLRPQRTS